MFQRKSQEFGEKTSLEINQNKLEHYRRRNNIEVSDIPCHRIGKNRNSSKQSIVRFTNRKFAKQELYNRKKLKSADKSTLGLTNDVFINENLIPVNNRIAYNCRKLKHQKVIFKTYTVNGMLHLINNITKRGKTVKVIHMRILLNLFPNVEFEGSNNENEDVNELADESCQSSY